MNEIPYFSASGLTAGDFRKKAGLLGLTGNATGPLGILLHIGQCALPSSPYGQCLRALVKHTKLCGARGASLTGRAPRGQADMILPRSNLATQVSHRDNSKWLYCVLGLDSSALTDLKGRGCVVRAPSPRLG